MLLQTETNHGKIDAKDVVEGKVQFQLGEDVGTSVMNEHPEINADFSTVEDSNSFVDLAFCKNQLH